MTLILSGTDGLSDIDGSAATPAIRGTDANTGIFFPAADTIAFAEGGAEVARFDSSGNLDIGTTVNNVLDQVGGSRPLLVQSGSSVTTIAGSTNAITVSNSNTTTNNASQLNFATITGASTNQYSTSVISGIHGARTNGEYPSGTLVFSVAGGGNTAPIERSRITGSNFFVNTASSFDVTAGAFTQVSGAFAVYNAGSPNTLVSFYNSSQSARVGFIGSSGNSTQYNSGSDYRLKDNVTNMSGALSKISALRPVTFTWKVSPEVGVVSGFIAHELDEVVPESVSGEKDAMCSDGVTPDYQMVDLSKLVPLLTAAIQEQQTMIQELTAKVAALEAKG